MSESLYPPAYKDHNGHIVRYDGTHTNIRYVEPQPTTRQLAEREARIAELQPYDWSQEAECDDDDDPLDVEAIFEHTLPSGANYEQAIIIDCRFDRRPVAQIGVISTRCVANYLQEDPYHPDPIA